jgi:hypothetical protein
MCSFPLNQFGTFLRSSIVWKTRWNQCLTHVESEAVRGITSSKKWMIESIEYYKLPQWQRLTEWSKHSPVSLSVMTVQSSPSWCECLRETTSTLLGKWS